MPGKWGLHNFYAKDPQVARLLPETRWLTSSSLRQLLKRHGSVYVKPNMEHMGKGVMKVWKAEDGYRAVKVKGKARRFVTEDTLVHYVMQQTGGKTHIVQQTIPLARLNERCFDIRVMMMRDADDVWRYTGMLAKVAGPSSIITNVRRGRGYATTVQYALTKSAIPDPHKRRQMERQLIDASMAICRRFNRYKYSSQVGIDFGVDVHGKLWLIEVNFDYPSHELFARLPDKAMYRLIKSRRFSYLRSKRVRRKV